MREHPGLEVLEGLVHGTLDERDRRSVVFHMIGGCEPCAAALRAVAGFCSADGEPPVLGVAAEAQAGIDAAVGRAIEAALASESRLPAERAEAPSKVARLLFGGFLPAEPSFWTRGLCEELLARAVAVRHQDKPGMLNLAELALLAAERLDPAVYGHEPAADLRARAWAELGNACRANDKLAQAEAALREAARVREEGTGDPLLLARLAELSAGLRCHQRSFPEAFRMLDQAQAIYRAEGRPHDAGRVLILKGFYTGYDNDPRQAIQLLLRGLELLDREHDPSLAFQTLHNVLVFRVDLGEFAAAQRQLWDMRSLYLHHAATVDGVKLRWIEGRIAAGLGRFSPAERAFRQVRKDFDAQGLGYHAAGVSLDLAEILLRQRRTRELRELVEKMVGTFRAQNVDREANAALLLLREAVAQDEATVELIRFVASILGRHGREPVES